MKKKPQKRRTRKIAGQGPGKVSKNARKGGRRGGGEGAPKRAVKKRRAAKAVAKRGRPRAAQPSKPRTPRPADCLPTSSGRGGGRGFGVVAAVVEGTGSAWDLAEVVVDRTHAGGGAVGGRKRGAGVGRLVTTGRAERASDVFAALGHPVRIAILVRLLEGAATYRALQVHTGLAAGPLYHHVNQLRLASLILPKKRDTYAMTRGGRNALLIGLATVPLVSDARSRPTVGGGGR